MHRENALTQERGFIALYAVLALAFLLAVVVLVMAHWDGMLQVLRQRGGEAQAQRIAHAFIQEQLAQEWTKVPRPWIPALRGEQAYGGAGLRWRRVPLESRWRAGARPWTPECREAWDRLGARPDRTAHWQAWMEQRQSALLTAGLGMGTGKNDLILDRGFLRGIFEDLGLGSRWSSPDRLWTLDEGGALTRVNLLGADPEIISVLSGVPQGRIVGFQAQAEKGFQDAGAAAGYWRFDEQQALDRWASVRPFSEVAWEVDVKLPTLRESVVTHWRVSQDEGTPGNPWFRIQSWSRDQW